MTGTRTILSVTYTKYKYPRPDGRIKFVAFREISGFKNPCINLKDCYGKGLNPEENARHVKELYCKDCEENVKSGGMILSLSPANSLYKHEQAVYGWARMIVLPNIPLSSIEDTEARKMVPL